MTGNGPSTDDLLRLIGVKQVTIEWLEAQLSEAREAGAELAAKLAELQGPPPPLKVVED